MAYIANVPDAFLNLLRDAPPCAYRVLGNRLPDPDEASASLDWTFVVFPTIGKASRLEPPIDWTQDPFRSLSWQTELHTLRFLDILFQRYRHSADLTALRAACDITLDWIAANTRGDSAVSSVAWLDQIVGVRAPFIGYLLRTTDLDSITTSSERSVLLRSAVDHARYLRDDSYYVATSNHGLYQDIGLVLLSNYLDVFPESSDWRSHGIRRFKASIERHISGDGENLYLEQSPFYHWLIVGLIQRFLRLASVDDAQLQASLADLEADGGWLVLPDGSTPPIGDSDMLPAPPWAQREAEQARGLRFFERSGFASVRTESSMLLVNASYHTHAHKHADDLGFCLFEGNGLLLGEAGKYGYDHDAPGREYAISSYAHNVVIVDDQPFTWFDRAPYGSGLDRAGSGEGWFAISGHNPLLNSQGVSHTRVYLYRPGIALILLDELLSQKFHRYTRLFHCGPDTSATVRDSSDVLVSNDQLTCRLSDHSGQELNTAVVTGRTEPSLSGWCFPTYRAWKPVPTVSLTSSDRNCLLITALTFGDSRPQVNVDGQLADTNVSLHLRNADYHYALAVQAQDNASLRVIPAG